MWMVGLTTILLSQLQSIQPKRCADIQRSTLFYTHYIIHMQKTEIKHAYKHWFDSFTAQLSFTGSVKQILMHDGVKEYATPHAIEKNVDRFINLASRRVLGRAAVRNCHKIRYTGCIEGREARDYSCSSRYHVHLSIGGIPDDFSLTDATQILLNLWESSKWGYRDNQCDIIHDASGWVDYTLKTVKTDNTDRFISNLALSDSTIL